MVVRMRHTRAHTANRRSHHALTTGAVVNCGSCGAARVRHQACPSCGEYRGKIMAGAGTKKAEKTIKRAAKKSDAKAA